MLKLRLFVNVAIDVPPAAKSLVSFARASAMPLENGLDRCAWSGFGWIGYGGL